MTEFISIRGADKINKYKKDKDCPKEYFQEFFHISNGNAD
jgi:hypothetical protein